jgi:hypothetical protein
MATITARRPPEVKQFAPAIRGDEDSVQGEAGSLWEKILLYYQFRREEFLKHYHLRSNA